MLLLRSLRLRLWPPAALPAPFRTRHERIIDLVCDLVLPGEEFRPGEVYALLRDKVGRSHRDFDTHLWIEVRRAGARLIRVGRGVYAVRASDVVELSPEK